MPEGAKLPAFFYRLSPRSQRTYLKSDAIDQYNFVPNGAALSRAQAHVGNTRVGLAGGDKSIRPTDD